MKSKAIVFAGLVLLAVLATAGCGESEVAPAGVAREQLAAALDLDEDSIDVVDVEEVEWPDGCLGIQVPGQACTEAVVPGYRVELLVGDQAYVYRTDLAGAQIVAVPSVTVEWIDAECLEAQVDYEDGVAFGTCDGVLVRAGLTAAQQRQLGSLSRFYTTGSAATPAGDVTFFGTGRRDPAPAESQMLAEWARGTVAATLPDETGAELEPVLFWHREGGIAGFCDNLAVYRTGEAVATTCAGELLGQQFLSAAGLQDLYGWVDFLEPFAWEQTDPATADAMTTLIVFNGLGDEPATDADIAAIQLFASDLFAGLATPGG